MTTSSSSYEIDFKVTCSDKYAVTTVYTNVVAPETEVQSQKNIQTIIDYIQSNGINLNNSKSINDAVTNVTTTVKTDYPESSEINDSLNNFTTNSSTQSGLILSLQDLYDKITNESLNDKVPETDDKSGQKPRVKTFIQKTPTKIINLSSKKTLGDKVSSIDTNLTSFNKNYGSLINTVKKQNSNNKSGQTIKTDITTGQTFQNGTSSTQNAKKGTVSKSKDNIFNRIARFLMGKNGMYYTNAVISSRSGNSKNPNYLDNFNITDIKSSLPNDNVTVEAYSYEISTKLKDGKIQVTYNYFPTDDTVNYQFTYSINTASLDSCSMKAFINAKKLSDDDKTEIVNNSGLATTSSPDNISDNQLWSAYLIWIYSYIAFGVQSQLIRVNNFKYPEDPNYDSTNYMFSYPYLESIGVPRNWPSYMYPNGSSSQNKSFKYSESSSILDYIKSQTNTSQTNTSQTTMINNNLK